jgi:flagellar hook assembly protein FlgD
MLKRRIYILSLLTAFLFTSLAFGQSVVKLKAYDGTPGSLLIAQIKADTLANKGIPAGRVYELEAGKIYLSTELFNVAAKYTLRLKGAEGKKAIIYLYPTGTGANPTRPPGNLFVLIGGNLEMSNIAVAGFFEPDAAGLNDVQGGLVNTTAAGSSIIVDKCVLSNINGQHIRTGSATKVVKVTNTIFANAGALTTSNFGAGKGLDLREASCDSLILLNNTFVNYQDRPIRHYNFANPLAGTGGLKYVRIEHNSFVNGMGFHGLLSLGNVGKEVIISNNLFVDAFASGEDSTDGTRAAEWANTGEKYPSGKNRMSWIFTAPNDTTIWKVKNNFYSISAAGQKFFDDNKSTPITEGKPLSWHINRRLGSDSVKAFQKQSVTLKNIPNLMINMMNWYLSPAGGNKTKNTPSSLWDKNLHDFDRRDLNYYINDYNGGYVTTSPLYMAAEKGFPVGDLNWFPTEKQIWDNGGSIVSVNGNEIIPNEFTLDQNYPNPFNPTTTISYALPKASNVSLVVFNALGQKVAELVNAEQAAGSYTVNWNGKDLSGKNVSSGIYFYQIKTADVSMTKKMMLLK